MNKSKKIMSLALAFGMVATLTAGATSAFAAESGDYSYELINGESEVAITAYNGDKELLFLPSRIDGKPVTVIAEEAFADNDSIESIVFPSSLRAIEDSAFEDCDRLEGLLVMNGLESVGDRAFAECDRLEAARLPKSVKTVGESAFYNCNRLESVAFKGVETVGAHACAFCNRLEEVYFGDTLQFIDDSAFRGNSRLEKVYFAGNAPELGSNVFFGADHNVTLYHKFGNTSFEGGQWEQFTQKNYLICFFALLP